jgi:DNA-binding transcriptional MerR regulator
MSGDRTPAEELPIQEVTRLTGTTSRTLRHYDAVGLLPPRRVAPGGTRWYGREELLRLQRILVLRGLGLSLAEIGRIVVQEEDPVAALGRHLTQLRSEQQRLARRTRSVERTITALTTGGPIMAEEMFDGFDHTQHQDEVTERWGAQAYADADGWWRGLTAAERERLTRRTADLAHDWTEAAARGVDPASDEAQELARRHVAWLSTYPGTPGHGGAPVPEYLLGLGDMYVADPRFAAVYGGPDGATLVRDALRAYVARPA